jgi:hypothetical protein
MDFNKFIGKISSLMLQVQFTDGILDGLLLSLLYIIITTNIKTTTVAIIYKLLFD